MLAAAASEGIDLSEEDHEPGIAATGPAAAGDPRPLLVIVDGQGRITRYAGFLDDLVAFLAPRAGSRRVMISSRDLSALLYLHS